MDNIRNVPDRPTDPPSPLFVGRCAACSDEIYDYDKAICPNCDKVVHRGCLRVCENCEIDGCRSCLAEDANYDCLCDECRKEKLSTKVQHTGSAEDLKALLVHRRNNGNT